MDCRTLQRRRGRCEWFERRQKCVGELSPHFQFERSTLAFLSVHGDKNAKKNCVLANGGRGGDVAASYRKVSVYGHILIRFFIVGHS